MPQHPPGTLAIIAALPRELASLARALSATRVSSRDGVLVQSRSFPESAATVFLITAGMGASRAALAVSAALSHQPVSALISVGLAGACDPQLAAGASVVASLVVDSRTGERFRTDPSIAPGGTATLVTAPTVAGPAEKLRLHHTYGAAVVDMEAATIARLARAHGIPFAAIKAISDPQTVDLSRLAAFAGRRGDFRTGAFILHTLLRPHTWASTAALGRDSKRALATLTSALQQIVVSFHTAAG